MKPSVKSVAANLTVSASIFLCGNMFGGTLSFGAFIGGVYCANPYFCCLVYLANAALYGLDALCFAGVGGAVVLLAYLIHKRLKRRIGLKLLTLYYFLANVFYCIYGTNGYAVLFNKLLNVAVGYAFSLVCIYVFRAALVRGLHYRPAPDERVSMALFAAVLSFGAASVRFLQYDLLSFIVPFLLLSCAAVFGGETVFVTATVTGIGALFAENSFSSFCLYALMALAAFSMNKLNRYVAAVSVVLTDILMAYFFGIHGNFDVFVLIPAASSALLFVLIPSKVYARFADLFGSTEQYAGRSVINRLSQKLSRKLYRLSDVFFAMQNTFTSMADSVSKEDAQTAIVRKISSDVCADCKERNHCWRDHMENTEKSMMKLSECALERGKVTILDITPALSFRCDRLNSVLATINAHAENYAAAIRRSKETNGNRLLLGEQLGGISKIVRQLAADCRGKVVFDSRKEELLKEELTFRNILTKDAVFIEQNGDLSVILTVAKKDFDNQAISKTVSGVVKHKMAVEKSESAGNGWYTVFLSPEPHFAVTYGVRSAVKTGSEMSGDTHSFVRIDNGKFMMAICDGMGSGEGAEKISETAISLVENFYKAGFDSDVILSGVNKLLGSFNSDAFTAVDICVADLNSGLCDFIKLGAPLGLVKSGGQVEFVSGSSLPLGVLEEMRPSITAKALRSGDTVALFSDGVWDSVGNNNALADRFSENKMTNPQIIADELMEYALAKCHGKPKDDMTVVVARLAETA